ncbi:MULTISPECIES: hypothetical protein [unclassified Nocardia]|uniref:hypothetical protein n=1 Tax=unclassified Nocardia TaxID=2637762 RepID=UPI001CE4B2E5|nr:MULTISPECIES: hypothetical protein [unclassified Nocardia]
MAEYPQWTPGAAQSHTWIDWSPATIGELLREADLAGWTSHILDSDPAAQLPTADPRIAAAAITAGPAADRLLDELMRRRPETTAHTAPVLLIIGKSRTYLRDPRLLTLARFGRITDVHLALDNAARSLLDTGSGPEIRDNIGGHRTSTHPAAAAK